MNIHHHLDDATALAYAAGTVTEALSLVIAAHVELCPQCQMRILAAEEVGGGVFDGLPAAPLADSSLDRVWTRIQAGDEPTATAPAPRRGPAHTGVPRVLEPFLPDGLDGIRWRSLAPGIRHYPLQGVESGQGTARLLSIAPGITIPRHSHEGTELTLVLRGSYSDEIGRFRAGDLADLDSSIDHQPIADAAEPCICLIATDARLRFSDLWSRMMQPLIGM